jgi:cytoskeleton protein RodZ
MFPRAAIFPFFRCLTLPQYRTYSHARKLSTNRCGAMARHHRDRFEAMARGTFGERLKRERELREVTLGEVSTATRIAPRFLEALENEQWNRLPGGIFGRGFVRSIARYLGLNEEDLLSEYDLARGENGSIAPMKTEERIPSPPKWIPVAALLVFLALLIGLAFGGRYAWRVYRAHRTAKKSSATVSIPAASEPQALPASATPEPPPAPTGISLDLSVAARTGTRLRVVADGNVIFDAELAAGEIRHFAAGERFEVTVADSSAVLLALNGQPVPPMGVPGSSGTIVLTAKDTRQATGGDTQH